MKLRKVTKKLTSSQLRKRIRSGKIDLKKLLPKKDKSTEFSTTN